MINFLLLPVKLTVGLIVALLLLLLYIVLTIVLIIYTTLNNIWTLGDVTLNGKLFSYIKYVSSLRKGIDK